MQHTSDGIYTFPQVVQVISEVIFDIKRIFVFLLVLSFLGLPMIFTGCRKGETLKPFRHIPRSIKLAEHPEYFQGTPENFEERTGELTIGSDTRQGFFAGDGQTLNFKLNLPVGGKLCFAYGVTHDAFRFAREITVEAVIVKDGETYQLGTSSMNTRTESDTSAWKKVEWEITPDMTGEVTLGFKASEFREGSPPELLLIAHPTVIFSQEHIPPPERVILIGIDTLRADHLGCYGYQRNTSDNIDAFAEQSTLYERCISTSPWTFPSFSSIMTGKYPSLAGAFTNVKYLPEDETTLAEILSSEDYSTFSVVNSPWVGKMTNLHRGFDSQVEMLHRRAGETFSKVTEWMRKHQNENLFVFVQLMDPHLPYFPKPTNTGKFGPSGYEGEYKEKFDIIPDNIELIRSGALSVAGPDMQRIEALYDEEIYGMDEDFARFMGDLQGAGFFSNSLIIITSDHGEEFWDHGGFEHGHQLYDELLHVPLIIRGKGFLPGQRVKEACSTTDIFPTILDYLKIPIPDELNAESLLRLKEERSDRWILSEQLYYGVEQKSVSSDIYRYILHTLYETDELYDIRDDPGMHQDVAQERRSTSRQFRYYLKEYTLRSSSGWHLRFARPGASQGGRLWAVSIQSDGGFENVEGRNLSEADSIIENPDSLVVKVDLTQPAEKHLRFTTPDESQVLRFRIRVDNLEVSSGKVFLGPSKVPLKSYEFELKIDDSRFGLGTPNFQKGEEAGLFIWGNSIALREEMAPDIDDKTREELKSLGYLQ